VEAQSCEDEFYHAARVVGSHAKPHRDAVDLLPGADCQQTVRIFSELRDSAIPPKVDCLSSHTDIEAMLIEKYYHVDDCLLNLPGINDDGRLCTWQDFRQTVQVAAAEDAVEFLAEEIPQALRSRRSDAGKLRTARQELRDMTAALWRLQSGGM